MYPIHTPTHAPAEEILQGPSLTTWNHKPLCQTAFSGSHFHSSASQRERERESGGWGGCHHGILSFVGCRAVLSIGDEIKDSA